MPKKKRMILESELEGHGGLDSLNTDFTKKGDPPATGASSTKFHVFLGTMSSVILHN